MSKTIDDASHQFDNDPSSLAQPGILTRCKDYLVAQVLRAGWPILMATANRWAPDRPPDKVFSYPERPWLKLRVWFPPSLDPTSKKPTRALFELHGGGWLFGAPTDVDHFSCHFSDHHDCVVVSLDYRKTWKNPFPTGLEDLEWTIERIFEDDSLCVDRHNAAAIGHSAGGNLVLGECLVLRC
jgi:acetyl esterase/lipase